MIQFILGLLGCQHKSWSWPRTVNKRTYQVCLDCGQERAYNFKSMEAGSMRSRA